MWSPKEKYAEREKGKDREKSLGNAQKEGVKRMRRSYGTPVGRERERERERYKERPMEKHRSAKERGCLSLFIYLSSQFGIPLSGVFFLLPPYLEILFFYIKQAFRSIITSLCNYSQSIMTIAQFSNSYNFTLCFKHLICCTLWDISM